MSAAASVIVDVISALPIARGHSPTIGLPDVDQLPDYDCVICRNTLHDSFARHDGLLSLARAFVLTELLALVPAGGKRPQPRVRRLFPALLNVVGAGMARGG